VIFGESQGNLQLDNATGLCDYIMSK
jgi:hypothetical protein